MRKKKLLKGLRQLLNDDQLDYQKLVANDAGVAHEEARFLHPRLSLVRALDS